MVVAGSIPAHKRYGCGVVWQGPPREEGIVGSNPAAALALLPVLAY